MLLQCLSNAHVEHLVDTAELIHMTWKRLFVA